MGDGFFPRQMGRKWRLEGTNRQGRGERMGSGHFNHLRGQPWAGRVIARDLDVECCVQKVRYLNL